MMGWCAGRVLGSLEVAVAWKMAKGYGVKSERNLIYVIKCVRMHLLIYKSQLKLRFCIVRCCNVTALVVPPKGNITLTRNSSARHLNAHPTSL